LNLTEIENTAVKLRSSLVAVNEKNMNFS
jgi:hypothetical protein